MFGRKNRGNVPSEPVVSGWPESLLRQLSSHLRSEEPRIATIVRGFKQMITLEAEAYAYHAGVEALSHSRNLALLVQRNEFAGTFGQRVRVEGSFGPVSTEHHYEALERGEIGQLSITTLDNGGDGPFTPLMEIHFFVRDQREEAIVQSALRGAFASNGAYLNAILDRVDDVDGWIRGFAEKGYSRRLTIKRLFIGAECGHGPFS